LGARKFAEIRQPDDFYLFQSPGAELARPATRIEEGYVKELVMPSTGFWAWENQVAAHDLLIMLGVEPHLRWNQYVDLILDLAQEYRVERIYSVGGTYDKIPHTIEPVISAVINTPGLKAELGEYGIESTAYQGHSSVHTLLMVVAGKRGLEAASLWGHAPHYIQVPNARVCYSLLRKLIRMLGIDLDLEDVRKAGEYLDEQVDKAVEQKAELQEYVKRLEEEYARGTYGMGGPLSGDIVKEVENFLQKRKDGEEGP
jgi:proteasome assembly chaperone (PAC2) family protein